MGIPTTAVQLYTPMHSRASVAVSEAIEKTWISADCNKQNELARTRSQVLTQVKKIARDFEHHSPPFLCTRSYTRKRKRWLALSPKERTAEQVKEEKKQCQEKKRVRKPLIEVPVTPVKPVCATETKEIIPKAERVSSRMLKSGFRLALEKRANEYSLSAKCVGPSLLAQAQKEAGCPALVSVLIEVDHSTETNANGQVKQSHYMHLFWNSQVSNRNLWNASSPTDRVFLKGLAYSMLRWLLLYLIRKRIIKRTDMLYLRAGGIQYKYRSKSDAVVSKGYRKLVQMYERLGFKLSDPEDYEDDIDEGSIPMEGQVREILSIASQNAKYKNIDSLLNV